jgi:hypothetical protein
VLVLGTDAVLHARPLSAGRLAEACRRAGYESVVPSSWGDELVAAACLEGLADVAPAPAALCVCPLARAAVAAAPGAVACLDFAAPPVAAARYVRELFGARPVHVTFAGNCPGADHAEIDARLTPAELLAEIRTFVTEADATGPDVMVHDSERRFRSLPGGAPAGEWLESAGGYSLDAVGELAGPPRERTLYDFAPLAGCACAGASLDVAGALSPAEARDAVAAGEPSRGAVPAIADSRAGLLARADEIDAESNPEPAPARPAVGPAARRAAASTPAARRDVATLVVPARGARSRRSDGSTRLEVAEPIRPHKSSEPIWDGPRRLPAFRIASVLLLVGVGVVIYASRPRPVLPPFAELPVPRQPVASTPSAAAGAAVPPMVAPATADTAPGVVAPAVVTPTVPPSVTASPSASARPARSERAAASGPPATRPSRSVAAGTTPRAAATPAGPAPATDPAAEQAAELRREIEARRARIDSLARSVDSLRAAEGRPRPPR